jgi:hypothetical protein
VVTTGECVVHPTAEHVVHHRSGDGAGRGTRSPRCRDSHGLAAPSTIAVPAGSLLPSAPADSPDTTLL